MINFRKNRIVKTIAFSKDWSASVMNNYCHIRITAAKVIKNFREKIN